MGILWSTHLLHIGTRVILLTKLLCTPTLSAKISSPYCGLNTVQCELWGGINQIVPTLKNRILHFLEYFHINYLIWFSTKAKRGKEDNYYYTHRLAAWNWSLNQNQLIYWRLESTTVIPDANKFHLALSFSKNLFPNISNILDFVLKEMQWTKGQEFLGYLFQSPGDFLFDI